MLMKLEAEGYITRKPHESDSRAIIVYPTQKAYEIYPALEGFGNNWINYLTSDMDDIGSVSYTHLDVYKRQAYEPPAQIFHK